MADARAHSLSSVYSLVIRVALRTVLVHGLDEVRDRPKLCSPSDDARPTGGRPAETGRANMDYLEALIRQTREVQAIRLTE
jgi:hypothetical protein